MADEPLEQFMAFYEQHGRPEYHPMESMYSALRRAFFAGYAARPIEPIAPSRDALTIAPYRWPDDAGLIRHGTITGRAAEAI